MIDADPHIVIIGKGVIEQVIDLLESYSHPLIVSDQQVYSRYGVRLDKLLGTKDRWVMVDQYVMGETQINEGTDVIVGFGGGRSIDTAKLLARDNNLNWVAIPTAASHDGIASDVASVTHDGYRYSERCKSPVAVVGDLSIIAEAPSILRRAGIGDIISKMSSLAEWKLGHEEMNEPFDGEIFDFMSNALNSVIRDDSLETLIRAQIDSGKAMSAFGSSRPCSGTEHAISHAMDREQYTLHGIQVAFATPLCVHYLHQSGYSEYRADDVITLLREKAIPHTMNMIGLNMESMIDNIHHALRIMRRRSRYSVLDHLNVQDPDLIRTIKELGY